MHFKKMLFITTLTLGFAISTASAQEQMNEGGQVETMTDEAPEMMPVKATGPAGMWTRRKNGEQVKAEFRDGALYCTIINRMKKSGKAKKDFEMCHGMTAVEGAWKGNKMKHPIAPGFMNFKGTVTVDGDVLKIKGCAGFCDSEEWDRVPAEG